MSYWNQDESKEMEDDDLVDEMSETPECADPTESSSADEVSSVQTCLDRQNEECTISVKSPDNSSQCIDEQQHPLVEKDFSDPREETGIGETAVISKLSNGHLTYDEDDGCGEYSPQDEEMLGKERENDLHHICGDDDDHSENVSNYESTYNGRIVDSFDYDKTSQVDSTGDECYDNDTHRDNSKDTLYSKQNHALHSIPMTSSSSFSVLSYSSTSTTPAQNSQSFNAQTTTISSSSSNSTEVHHSCNESASTSWPPTIDSCEGYELDCDSKHSNGIVDCLQSYSKAPASYLTTSPVITSAADAIVVDSCHNNDHSAQVDGKSFVGVEYSEQPFPEELNFHSQLREDSGSPSSYAQMHDSLSSYKQSDFGECSAEHLADEEEMEGDSHCLPRKTDPNVYQSYDNATMVSMNSHYLPSTSTIDNGSQLQEVGLADLSLENENSSSYVLTTEETVKESSAESSEMYASSITNTVEKVPVSTKQSTELLVLPVSASPPPSNDNNEGAMRTGDQNFKNSNLPSTSHSSISSIDASQYAGPSVIQVNAMKQQQGLMSSTVHIAQHQGATIMQHQSMTAGCNGDLTQSTVLQKQALPNGMQTALLHQRTISNGGQTMLVQQRTMTNVLGGGMAQQTVVQRVVPGVMARQSAALQAQAAMRQQVIASQQVSIMQQQALRTAQVQAQARMMGSPLLQAQTLAAKPTTVIPRAVSAASYLGPRYVQASPTRGSVMQRLVRQRYMGSPVLPARSVQVIGGRPVRIKMAYTRDALGYGS